MAELYIPQASDWINAFQTGKQARMATDRDDASRRAGGLMTSGDYKGAAGALYGIGDLAGGAQVEQVGAAKETTRRRAEYGQQVAAGKGAEAAQAAYGAGDWDEGGQIQKIVDSADERSKAFMKEKAERIAAIVAPLGEIPETDMPARMAYIQTHQAELIAAGYTPDQVATFEPTNANLAPIYTQAMGLKDYLSFTDKKADNVRADAQQQEAARHNRASEGVAAGNLAERRRGPRGRGSGGSAPAKLPSGFILD